MVFTALGNGLTKGKSLVLTQKTENSFSLLACRLVALDYLQGRFDFIQKTGGCFVVKPVKKEGRRFTENIPSPRVNGRPWPLG